MIINILFHSRLILYCWIIHVEWFNSTWSTSNANVQHRFSVHIAKHKVRIQYGDVFAWSFSSTSCLVSGMLSHARLFQFLRWWRCTFDTPLLYTYLVSLCSWQTHQQIQLSSIIMFVFVLSGHSVTHNDLLMIHSKPSQIFNRINSNFNVLVDKN